jgi:hypothetical protein
LPLSQDDYVVPSKWFHRPGLDRRGASAPRSSLWLLTSLLHRDQVIVGGGFAFAAHQPRI